MSYPINVIVRYRAGAYHCRFPNGTRASSTNCAQVAVERLMDKTWAPGTHRATQVRREMDLTEFKIEPIEEITQ